MQCPDTTRYEDKLLDKNLFMDKNGLYCNCWVNNVIEKRLVPQLEEALAMITSANQGNQ